MNFFSTSEPINNFVDFRSDFFSNIFVPIETLPDRVIDVKPEPKVKPVPQPIFNDIPVSAPTIISQPIFTPTITQQPNVINNYVQQFDPLPITNMTDKLNSFVSTLTNTTTNTNKQLDILQTQITSIKTNNENKQILDILDKVNQEIATIKTQPVIINKTTNANLDELTKQTTTFNARLTDQQNKINELANNLNELQKKESSIIADLQNQLSLSKNEFKRLQADIKPVQTNIYPSYNEVLRPIKIKSCLIS